MWFLSALCFLNGMHACYFNHMCLSMVMVFSLHVFFLLTSVLNDRLITKMDLIFKGNAINLFYQCERI